MLPTDLIDKKTHEIKQDEDKVVYKSLEEIAEDLPDNSPRYILLSYPLTLVRVSPPSCSLAGPCKIGKIDKIVSIYRANGVELSVADSRRSHLVAFPSPTSSYTTCLRLAMPKVV